MSAVRKSLSLIVSLLILGLAVIGSALGVSHWLQANHESTSECADRAGESVVTIHYTDGATKSQLHTLAVSAGGARHEYYPTTDTFSFTIPTINRAQAQATLSHSALVTAQEFSPAESCIDTD